MLKVLSMDFFSRSFIRWFSTEKRSEEYVESTQHGFFFSRSFIRWFSTEKRSEEFVENTQHGFFSGVHKMV